MYTELNLTFLGLKVPNVGMLIMEDQNQVLDKKNQTKLPGILGWNLIWLSYNTLVKNVEHQDLASFECPRELILCCSFSYASDIFLTYVKTICCE